MQALGFIEAPFLSISAMLAHEAEMLRKYMEEAWSAESMN